jgi:hypothetical protein
LLVLKGGESQKKYRKKYASELKEILSNIEYQESVLRKILKD